MAIIVRDSKTGRVLNVSRDTTAKDLARSRVRRKAAGRSVPKVATPFSVSSFSGGGSVSVDVTGRVTVKSGGKVVSKSRVKPGVAVKAVQESKVFETEVQKARKSVVSSRVAQRDATRVKAQRVKELKQLVGPTSPITVKGREVFRKELKKLQRTPAKVAIDKAFTRQALLSAAAKQKKSRIDKLLRRGKVQELLLRERDIVKDVKVTKFKTGDVRGAVSVKKEGFRKLSKIEKFNILEDKVSRKIGTKKLASSLRSFARRVEFRGSGVPKFGFEIGSDLVADVLEKPIYNTVLVAAGFGIGKGVQVGGKVLKVIGRSSPKIASRLRLGGKIGGGFLTTLYAGAVVQQGAEELADKGKLSKTTADLIRELALLGVGSRLAGKKIPKSLKGKFFSIKKDASKILSKSKKGKVSKSFFKGLKSVKQKPIQIKLSKPKKTLAKKIATLPEINSKAISRLRESQLKGKRAISPLEKERITLRKESALERKVSKGLQVKALREGSAVVDGKKVFLLQDVFTGKTRSFASRKKWLSAVRRQRKLLASGLKPKKDVKVTSFLKEPVKKFDLSIFDKPIPISKVKPKQKRVSKIKTLVPKVLSVEVKKGGKTFKVVQKKDGSAKVFLVSQDKQVSKGGQVLLTKQKLKKPKLVHEVKVKQKLKLKSKTKVRQRVVTVQKVATKQKLKSLSALLLSTSVLEKAIQRQGQVLAVAQKQKVAQKLKQFPAQKVAQKLKQIPAQKIGVVQKLRVAQALRVGQRLRFETRLKSKLKLISKSKLKPPKPPKVPKLKQFPTKLLKKSIVGFKPQKVRFTPTIVRPKKIVTDLRLFSGAELR